MTKPLNPEVTDTHRAAADELLRDLNDLPIAPVSQKKRDRLAQRLAMLEHRTKTVVKTERSIVGDRDRWVIISKVSPSGKTLFVCRSCGGVGPSPTKKCAAPVKLWNGEVRECADWEPEDAARSLSG